MGENGTESRKSRGVLLKAGPVILRERERPRREKQRAEGWGKNYV